MPSVAVTAGGRGRSAAVPGPDSPISVLATAAASAATEAAGEADGPDGSGSDCATVAAVAAGTGAGRPASRPEVPIPDGPSGLRVMAVSLPC